MRLIGINGAGGSPKGNPAIGELGATAVGEAGMTVVGVVAAGAEPSTLPGAVAAGMVPIGEVGVVTAGTEGIADPGAVAVGIAPSGEVGVVAVKSAGGNTVVLMSIGCVMLPRPGGKDKTQTRRFVYMATNENFLISASQLFSIFS